MDALANRSLVTVRDGNSVTYVIDGDTNKYTQIGGSSPECEAFLAPGDWKMYRTPLIIPSKVTHDLRLW